MNVKPLIVLVMFVLLIALFAGGAIGSTDLTPDTPPATPAPVFDAVQPANAPLLPGGSGAAYSSCGGAYTIRSGDTLSSIARTCGITLSELLAANPSIHDPNVISVGQNLHIPFPQAAGQTPTPGVAGAESGQDSQNNAAVPLATATYPAAVLPNGTRPGGSVHVTMKDLPPVTILVISIGKVGDNPTYIDERETNENGELELNVAIPWNARPGEIWMVTVTGSQPKLKVTSDPFLIEQ